MPPRSTPATTQGSRKLQTPLDAGAYHRAVRDPGKDLIKKFRGKPIQLAERFGLKLPEKPAIVMDRLGVYDEERFGPIVPGLRELIEDVCLGRVQDAVVVGPRGGGKSFGVAFIEFYLWMIESFDALNFGGSELQAANVYDYLVGFMEHDPYWQTLLKGETKLSESKKKDDAWIKVLTASSKSVRSPHAGGERKGKIRGGLLVIDEEAEAEPELVNTVLWTVNTAQPSVTVRSSTFHNAEGTFADLIDDHVKMGYKLYKFDIFDMCAGCDCAGGPDECQSDEKCFREDHFVDVENPDTGETEEHLLHRAYCGGRAKYARGHIPMTEVVKSWLRIKRNHGIFEVEAMGSRPTTSGHVIKDRMKYAENCEAEPAETLYQKGAPVSICVDWGAVQGGITVWQEQWGDRGERHVLLHADLIEETGLTQQIGIIVGYFNRYLDDVVDVACDIGGGGMFNNPMLRDEYGLPVRDVDFGQEKETAAAAWNLFNEANKCVYPVEFEDWHDQIKRWKRKNGRIQKGGDHLMDSSICYFAKFIDRIGLRKVRVPPRSTNTQPNTGVDAHFSKADEIERKLRRKNGQSAGLGRPMARAVGNGRRRGSSSRGHR